MVIPKFGMHGVDKGDLVKNIPLSVKTLAEKI
jgi:hypothetical protein